MLNHFVVNFAEDENDGQNLKLLHGQVWPCSVSTYTSNLFTASRFKTCTHISHALKKYEHFSM